MPGAGKLKLFLSSGRKQFWVAETRHKMIIDHTGGLHECVTDGGADEGEAALDEIFAKGVGFGCVGWQVAGFLALILKRPAADELPDILVERAEFFANGEEGLRVANGCSDLQTIADDAGIRE